MYFLYLKKLLCSFSLLVHEKRFFYLQMLSHLTKYNVIKCIGHSINYLNNY